MNRTLIFPKQNSLAYTGVADKETRHLNELTDHINIWIFHSIIPNTDQRQQIYFATRCPNCRPSDNNFVV